MAAFCALRWSAATALPTLSARLSRLTFRAIMPSSDILLFCDRLVIDRLEKLPKAEGGHV